ncbi:exopolysaccharide biosynthesis polyprenyl glycosylphosphotransferase [Ligilactobacillus acidipiscis]|uniref:exopolysaccharide biosynthesis polyprenyl glycosylphosphotransferase n=1 Tax=Ligilactobacillus acidipiscis TaxID=89059 RepID=UPI0023F675F2|nr:exopolysaccharide biosynthesis polyprenyl glycosylphosphotransferase [Ligilactobacillus acidipiscis]WEV56547.1 exopolysaccharide biosynthesis polyprenyl glycosylphosphotransferase [Ligilactobacillus acidipiscis]
MSNKSPNDDSNLYISKYFHHDLQLRFLKVLDLCLLTLVFAGTWFFAYAKEIIDPFYGKGNWVVICLFALIYFLYGRTYDAFVVSLSSVSEKFYSQVLSCFFTDSIMYVVIALLTRHFPQILPIITCLLVQAVISYIWSSLSSRWYFKVFPAKKTIIIYDKESDLLNTIGNNELENKFDVQKTIHANNITIESLPMLKNFEIAFLANVHSHERNQIIKYCIQNDIRVYILPRIGDVIMSGAERMHILHLPVLHLVRYSPKPEFLILKRLFDIISAGFVLIIVSPLMLIIAGIIKMTDRGPILYKQTRLTKDGREFNILKFRSMKVDAEKDGVARLSTGKNDTRVTSIGKVIRKVRFDELPQLLNIIKGDMSVVGPRPERPEIAKQYEERLPEFSLRLQAKAGLTGYAQVYGKYNTIPYDKLEMDLMYIAKPSIFEDLKIIFATIKILFESESTEGVSNNEVTELEFPKKDRS